MTDIEKLNTRIRQLENTLNAIARNHGSNYVRDEIQAVLNSPGYTMYTSFRTRGVDRRIDRRNADRRHMP